MTELRPSQARVDVRVALLAPESASNGARAPAPLASFSGVVSAVGAEVGEGLRIGQAVVGVGPLGETVTTRAGDLRVLPAEPGDPFRAAIVPYLSSLSATLREVPLEPRDRVLVSGHQAIRRLCEPIVESVAPQRSASETTSGSDGDPEEPFDVLVHGLADAEDLQLGLSRLRHDGRALLLVPPGRHPLALDFYPHIHRSSLRLSVRRAWEASRSGPGPDDVLIGRIGTSGSLDVDGLLIRAPGAALDALPLEEASREGKLVAIDWR